MNDHDGGSSRIHYSLKNNAPARGAGLDRFAKVSAPSETV
jgi:hypothetical protein